MREKEPETPNIQACSPNTVKTRCFHSAHCITQRLTEIKERFRKTTCSSQVANPNPGIHLLLLGNILVVSHGEVIAPDFSNFLLFDKAAACFRSSLFLALKKQTNKNKTVQEGCFNRIGYIFFHADAGRCRWSERDECILEKTTSSRTRFGGKKNLLEVNQYTSTSWGPPLQKDVLCNTNQPWSALMCWINRIYNSEIWNHICFTPNFKESIYYFLCF